MTEVLQHIPEVFTAKDLVTDQEVRWCPGCGDYSILKQVQTVMPNLGYKKEEIVFVSGIGCSSRFPYYMDTFGMHSIHGRATAIATGLKTSRPELNVWIVTGDGDALSIGGNHFIHLLRRNLDVNLLLFNNQIYGLTKGQYSPTSVEGQVTKSTPFGSLDHPFNPLALAMGADASFVARSMDRDPKHLQQMIERTAKFKGTSLLEIYQNCNVFNDGAFFTYTDKETKAGEALFVENGKPLIYGEGNNKGIRLNNTTPEIVDLTTGEFSTTDLWVHDEKDYLKSTLLTRFFDSPDLENHFPRPFGVLYAKERPCYEDAVHAQIAYAKEGKEADLDSIIRGRQTWVVK
ncbi:MAG: 2-oxoacid:ferredoxin oxidoreductase subunit beta [Bacteroidetes bacterium]|nr:2-oxoacid:ferredoxin oxidoreductase subunit beta [Bacteroidota bacterium]